MPLLILMLALTCLATTASARADWNIDRFVVVPGPIVSYSELLPDDTNVIAYENAHRTEEDMLPPNVLQHVQRAVNEAAHWYRAQGFPEPKLNTVVNTPEGPAYQVYLCKQRQSLLEDAAAWLNHPSPFSRCDPADGSGQYLPVCNNEHSRNQIFYLVAPKVLDSQGKLTDGGYQTIAHELFHAIAANSPAMTSDPNCKVGKWISEGLADGIGYDLLHDLSVAEEAGNGAYNAPEVWAGRFAHASNDNAVGKSWGIRPYNIPLPHPNGEANREVPMPVSGAPAWPWYHSSSFWRYVAHASGEGWRVLTTSPYGNGKGLLDIPFPQGYSGWQRDVYWLHQGLRGKFGLGLNMVYADFVNDYALRLPPISRFGTASPVLEQVRSWANMTFDTCKEITLTSERPFDVVTLKLDAMAAACIWVHPTHWPDTTQISFQAYSGDTELLEDIIIGRPGAGVLSRPNQVGGLPADGQNIGIWPDYPQDGSKPSLYIVSNVAKKHPARTMPREIELWVSLPDNVVDQRSVPQGLATRPLEDPHLPVRKRQIPSRTQKQKQTADKVAQQMERDKRTLSPNVRAATDLSRQASIPHCSDPFKFAPCGPHLTVSLSLAPGTYIIPGATTAQGGIAAQVFGGLQAMSRTSMGDQTATLTYLDDHLDRIDASQVSIALPLIDYGFTGSFDNASITVAMSGERSLRTIGPPDASGRTPLTGQVTIEEYSPMQLRGSFSAPLAEFLPATSDATPPRYVRRETITGRFQIVAPWLADERVERLQLDSPEDIAYDIADTLGISPDAVQDMQQRGMFNGQNRQPAAGSDNETFNLDGECTCECSMRTRADELCELLCEEEFAACR